MQIFREIEPLRRFLTASRSVNRTIGLVPTMGSLHEGHLELIKASRKAMDLTVCSIYVNPHQFNNPDDLAKYPRTPEPDAELLKGAQCDVLFCPSDAEMYPEEPSVVFDFGPLGQVMEGRFRPGHFSGVALVVSKLLHIVEPQAAYFGQKDWQQTMVIRRLVDNLKFNVNILVLPTKREADGLAMSSRNKRLTSGMREKAVVYYHALCEARRQLREDPDVKRAKTMVDALVQLVQHARLEYFEVVDRATLQPLDRVDQSKEPILCIAGYVGEVRLIDNLFF